MDKTSEFKHAKEVSSLLGPPKFNSPPFKGHIHSSPKISKVPSLASLLCMSLLLPENTHKERERCVRTQPPVQHNCLTSVRMCGDACPPHKRMFLPELCRHSQLSKLVNHALQPAFVLFWLECAEGTVLHGPLINKKGTRSKTKRQGNINLGMFKPLPLSKTIILPSAKQFQKATLGLGEVGS